MRDIATFSGAACSFRDGLLTTVAAGALVLVAPGLAKAQIVPPSPECVVGPATTVTCTGALGAGVEITAPTPYTILNLNNLTEDIAPAAGVDGVRFTSANDVTIDVATGNFIINSTGSAAIYARSTGGAVTVTASGDIEAGFQGIYATSFGAGPVVVTQQAGSTITSQADTGIFARSVSGNVVVTTNGDVDAYSTGVYAQAYAGTVDVDLTGTVTSQTGNAVSAFTGGASDVSVTGGATIQAEFDGIFAESQGGVVTVDVSGDIASNAARGIFAKTSGAGDVSVTSNGAIEASSDGINAGSYSGAVSVTQTGGSITSQLARGIYARAYNAGATVETSGDVEADQDGVVVIAGTLATVTQTGGTIYSAYGAGISATGANGATVTISGDVDAYDNGVFAANATGGAVSVTQNSGTVYSYAGAGIVAYASAGSASVTANGVVRAYSGGVVAVSTSGGPVTVTQGAGGVIEALGGDGILGLSDGNVSVTSAGQITSAYSGISALSTTGAVTISQASSGVIESGETGILAYAYTGTVNVTTSGTVESQEQGIVAVTAGAGPVTVTQLAGAITSATQSAIHVGGAGNLVVAVAGMTTGAAGAAGVEFGSGAYAGYDGAANMLTIAATGIVENAGGIGQMAVLGRLGSEAVTNAGTVTGSVHLGGGVNSFTNAAGGLFNMGPVVNLGAGNALTNSGTLSPGGAGTIATVTVTGNLVQTASGTLAMDVSGAGNTADRINVSGTANLAGTVNVNLLSPASTSQEFTIVSAAGGATNNGLALTGGLPATFTILYPNANDVVLGATLDFSLGGGLNPNQTALGETLNDIVNAGTGGLGAIINALIGITDPAEYQKALNQLLPEHYAQLMAAGLIGAQDFSQSLMSCRVRDGGFAYIAEGQCLWAEIGASRFDLDATRNQVGFEEDSHRVAAGAQLAVAENVRFGFAARYESVDQTTGNFARSDGDRGHIGAALKYTTGPVLLAAAVSAGRSWYDTDRTFAFNGFTGVASSSHEVDYVSGMLRAAYLMPMGGWYVKPLVDLNVSRVETDGFTERGGAGAGLTVAPAKDTFLSVSPALEIGAEWRLSTEAIMRPFVRAGVTIHEETEFAVTSRFTDAPGGAGGFVTRTEIDDVMGDVTVGLDILGASGVEVRIHYEGSFGETTTLQSVGARAGVKF